MDATNAKAMGLAMAMKLAKALRWTTWSSREVVPSSMRADASTASTFLSASCPMKPHQAEVTHSPVWIGVAETWVEPFSSVGVTMDFPGRRRNRRPGPAFETSLLRLGSSTRQASRGAKVPVRVD